MSLELSENVPQTALLFIDAIADASSLEHITNRMLVFVCLLIADKMEGSQSDETSKVINLSDCAWILPETSRHDIVCAEVSVMEILVASGTLVCPTILSLTREYLVNETDDVREAALAWSRIAACVYSDGIPDKMISDACIQASKHGVLQNRDVWFLFKKAQAIALSKEGIQFYSSHITCLPRLDMFQDPNQHTFEGGMPLIRAPNWLRRGVVITYLGRKGVSKQVVVKEIHLDAGKHPYLTIMLDGGVFQERQTTIQHVRPLFKRLLWKKKKM